MTEALKQLVQTSYEEGRKEGLKMYFEEAFKEGYKEGFREGFREGFEIGVREATETFVRNMAEAGFSPDRIVRLTGASANMVQRILDHMAASDQTQLP